MYFAKNPKVKMLIYIFLFSLCVFLLTFGACSNEPDKGTDPTNAPEGTPEYIQYIPAETPIESKDTPAATASPAPTPSPTQQPTATATPKPTATLKPNSSPGADVSTHADYYGKKIIVLTFDDGPHYLYTDKLLDGLKERGVKVTFFVTGIGYKDNAWDLQSDARLLKRIVQEGHEIGNHTQNHKALTKLTEEEIRQELSIVNDRVRDITGYEIKLFRPPSGVFSKKVLDASGMAMVHWTLDTNDWKFFGDSYLKKYAAEHSVSIEEARAQTVKYLLDVLTGKLPNDDVFTGDLKHGSILLFHDLYEGSVDLALALIDELTKDGYVFLPLSEAIRTVGAIPAAGEAYKSIWEGYGIRAQ